MNTGVSITRPRLQGLSAANFTAFDRHSSIIGHILRFKRTGFNAVAREDTAKPGHQQGFANI